MTSLNCNQLKKGQRKNDYNTCQSPILLPSFLEANIDNKTINVSRENMIYIKSLGEGSFSSVQLMKDKVYNVHLAVKIFDNLDQKSTKAIKTDIDIGNSVTSIFKIHYYGAIRDEHSIWIVMDPMDLSVADFYTKLLNIDQKYHLPGSVIGYMAYCSVYGLEDLHKYKIIHRDVKPSNMLIDKAGSFKLCDFGISSKMKDSIAKSAVGTRAYLAPERINPKSAEEHYTIKSDVWSLGLSIMELAVMMFPFGSGLSMMEQLNAIVLKPSPKLPETSPHINDIAMLEFLNYSLTKSIEKRKRYVDLKELSFIKRYNEPPVFNRAKTELSDLVTRLS